ncbi:MAG TPA: hypothetical protein VFH48_20565 [Chloroflexota bacterium]|nr:hypothetical protein [Chloroflexota bacterium]
MAPDLAWRALAETFVARGTVAVLQAEAYVQLMSSLATGGTLSGQVYDAAIVACARRAGVEVLITFNERHFRRFEGDGLAIEVA